MYLRTYVLHTHEDYILSISNMHIDELCMLPSVALYIAYMYLSLLWVHRYHICSIVCKALHIHTSIHRDTYFYVSTKRGKRKKNIVCNFESYETYKKDTLREYNATLYHTVVDSRHGIWTDMVKFTPT